MSIPSLKPPSAQKTHYVCPVCEVDIDRYLPLPSHFLDEQKKHGYIHDVTQGETLNLEAYLCPKCESSDRDRLCALFMKDYFKNKSSHSNEKTLFVDFSPSKALTGLLRQYSFLNYRTADFFRNDVDDQIDLMDIRPYGNNAVDYFICSHVLEHVPNDHKAASELYRILKPGGWGLLLAPILLNIENTYEDPTKVTEAERWQHFGQGDHYRIYSKQGFISLLENAGFHVTQLGPEHFGMPCFQTSGIAEKSTLYVVSKP